MGGISLLIMTKVPYWKRLQDPRWQRKRLEILERDKWECKSCGTSDKTLNVHHAFYISGREPWEYGNGSLQTLCEDCHKEASKTADSHPIELLMDLLNGNKDIIWELAESIYHLTLSGSMTAEEICRSLSYSARSGNELLNLLSSLAMFQKRKR